MAENCSGELPSDEELSGAILKAKEEGFSSSDLKHTDEGAALVRSYLPPRFHIRSLDWMRRIQENFSKAGKEPGARKRKPSENADAAINRLVQAYPPRAEHSEEYHRLHSSPEWQERVRALKKLVEYQCLLCCRHFVANDLEGHVRDYQGDHWKKPFGTVILCVRCHGVADALRRRGKDQEGAENGRSGQAIYDLADED